MNLIEIKLKKLNDIEYYPNNEIPALYYYFKVRSG